MKKLTTLLICALTIMSINSVYAQKSERDTTKMSFGDVEILILEKSKSKDSDTSEAKDPKKFNAWTGIELGIGGVLTSDNSLTMPDELSYMELDYSRSLAWNFNFADVEIFDITKVRRREGKDYVRSFGLISGLGISFRNYGLENNYHLVNVDDSTYAYEDTLLNYSKNKFRAVYLRMPLMLQFYTMESDKHQFHFAAGLVGGVRTGSSYKRKYKLDGEKKKNKVRNDFNLQSFTLDAEVRFGYKGLNFFASYGLTPLFEDDKGPELYPFTAGISLSKLF